MAADAGKRVESWRTVIAGVESQKLEAQHCQSKPGVAQTIGPVVVRAVGQPAAAAAAGATAETESLGPWTPVV